MTSRERIMAAINHEELDHLPLYLRAHGIEPPPQLSWKNDYERVEKWISLGLDDILFVQSPLTRDDYSFGQGDPIEFASKVITKMSSVDQENEDYPLLTAEYQTPGGVLSQVVRKTEDWDAEKNLPYPHGGDKLLLFDDFNVPRAKKFLIEGEKDVRKLKHLFPLPSKAALRDYERYIEEVRNKVNRLGILTATCTSIGTDALIWLCGVERAILMSYDKPAMLEELLDIIHQRDILATKICLDSGLVDMIVRRGWYEGCNFWSPTIYRRHFVPRIKELVRLAHEAGKLFGYILPNTIMPILPDLADIGYDIHWYPDEVQGGADYVKLKETFTGKIAMLGGINESVTMEMKSPDEIKRSVRHTVEVLGKGGGLVLSVNDALYSSTPWESIEAVIEEWRALKGSAPREF